MMWLKLVMVVLAVVGVSMTADAVAKIDIQNARHLPVGVLQEVVGNGYFPPAGDRVIGGAAAVSGQFPYQAAVYFLRPDGFTYFCGGSLISARYVLTAAHCTIGSLEYTVVLGAVMPSNASEPGRQSFSLAADAAVEHPEYNSRVQRNDIALLTLPSAARMSDVVQTIRLPSKSQAANNVTFEDELAVVSGWGKTSDAVNQGSAVLMYAAVPVIGNPLCMLHFLSVLYGISATQVCSGGTLGTNACSGDSGGPLTVVEEDGVLTEIGLVSIGFSQCESGRPTAHSRLTAYLDFIQEFSDVQIRA